METLTVRYVPPKQPSALDPASQPEYAERLRAGLHQALIDAGADELGAPCVIRVATAMAELVRIMAFVSHNAPTMQVPSRRRIACDGFAKSLRQMVDGMQQAAAAGELPEFIRVDDTAIEWPR